MPVRMPRELSLYQRTWREIENVRRWGGRVMAPMLDADLAAQGQQPSPPGAGCSYAILDVLCIAASV